MSSFQQPKRFSPRVVWWIKRVLVVTLVLYVCLLVWSTHTSLDEGTLRAYDKLLHLMAYAVLGFVAHLTFLSWKTLREALGTIALVWCFGAIDELTQPYFGRQADIFDWLADAMGGVIGVLAGQGVYHGLWQRGIAKSRNENSEGE